MLDDETNEWAIRLQSSDTRKREVYHRFGFYRAAAFSSALITIAGVILLLAFLLLLGSVVVTAGISTDSWNTATKIAVSLTLSIVAVKLLRDFREIEKVSLLIRGSQTDNSENWPGTLDDTIIGFFGLVTSGYLSLRISTVTAQVTLTESLKGLINNGKLIGFTLQILSHLTLAGTILTMVFIIAMFRYMTYPWTRGIRAQFNRWFYRFVDYFVGPLEDEELRCAQCISKNQSAKQEDDRFVLYCDYCGRRMGTCSKR